jgi:hypothetical protein
LKKYAVVITFEEKSLQKKNYKAYLKKSCLNKIRTAIQPTMRNNCMIAERHDGHVQTFPSLSSLLLAGTVKNIVPHYVFSGT